MISDQCLVVSNNKLLAWVFCGVFWLFLCTGAVFAGELEDLLGTERAAELIKNAGKLTQIQFKNPKPLFIPDHRDIKNLIFTNYSSLQPSIFIETLYLYKKPGINNSKKWTESQKLILFNTASKISSLAGIQYYSASYNSMRTLYELSQCIEGPQSKKPASDPEFGKIPETFTVFARQKDLSFGDNIYRYDYFSFPDAFAFLQENYTAMNAGIIPAFGKNKLRSIIAVFDTGDSMLIYFVSMAKAASFPGMDSRIGNSFNNRAEAIINWFIKNAEKALAE